jgi:hypothetical protein
MSEYNGQTFKDVHVPEGAIVLGRIDVVMYMRPDDEDIMVATRTDDGHGDRLPLVNSLGMIEMAKKVINDIHGQASFVEDPE